VCKLVLDIRSIPVEKSVSPRFVRMLKFAKAFFNGVAYITPGTRKYIEEKIGVKVPRTTIWTSAVNPASFSPSQTVPDANLAELTKDRFVLFYHGSISANRGVHHVLDALHQVVQQVPEILFVSLSDNNKFITEYCSKQGYDLSKHLLLLDAVENHLVPRYIKAADFCVVPLPRLVWWEVSSPLKLMEYLAMEKPVILTNIAAHTDVVPADADFCVYYDPDVSGDLARQIVHAAAQRANYQQRAYKGRSLIEAKFTWDHQAQKLVEFAQSA
jgi:glycosyltransferase involved in cell wall biosynthesis